MAALGFNVFAIQEDLMNSAFLSKASKREKVLGMLSQFNVLSIQVVFALLDLSQETYELKVTEVMPI